MALSIPITFTIGIVAYVLLFPQESKTLDNFISYTSGLSAILMVLVVIYTTSLQLTAMKQQLKEMESTRLLQAQPFPLIKPLAKSYFEKPRLFIDPVSRKSYIGSRLCFCLSLENTGNGPAVSIDIVPKLHYYDENGDPVTEAPVYTRIESLKQNEKKEVEIIFVGGPVQEKRMMNELILMDLLGHYSRSTKIAKLSQHKQPNIELAVLYRNTLGGSFMESIVFRIWLYDEDVAGNESCLELLERAREDYAKDLRKVDSFIDKNQKEEDRIWKRVQRRLSNREGCHKVEFFPDPLVGSFSVRPISEEEYNRQLQTKYYPRRMAMTRAIANRSQDNY